MIGTCEICLQKHQLTPSEIVGVVGPERCGAYAQMKETVWGDVICRSSRPMFIEYEVRRRWYAAIVAYEVLALLRALWPEER